jgi:hypothetical protein
MFKNIPEELRVLKQWCVWRYEDTDAMKPTKVPYCPHNNRLCSVDDPRTWGRFGQALEAYESGLYSGIGFVINESDPYTFIDLDHTTDDKLWARQSEIADFFDSYAEVSPSGKGLHIIVRGSVPSGRKRNAIEVYSDLRYMTMTGNVYKQSEIKDYQNEVFALWESLEAQDKKNQWFDGKDDIEFSDYEILDMAYKAANGQKFVDLYEGNYEGYYTIKNGVKNYFTHSEADFALIDILAFYSKNKSQIVRLFMQSELGKREKAKRSGYINYMLNRCFDNMLPPVDIDGLRNKINEIIEQKAKKKRKEKNIVLIPDENELEPDNEVYSIPDGLLGDIAKFIYAQAARPVPEIALAAAIGCMAGVCGRAYNISGHGLNQYTLMIAKTGHGKGAMKTGVSKLFASVKHTLPTASEFMGPGAIASQQAIIKFMSGGRNSIVSMLGEFGHTMQQLCNRNAQSHLVGIRQFLLLTYDFSGHGIIMEPTIYSEKEKNTKPILSPAFSLLGETTPEIFYEGLHEGLISEGFLPRFTIIEYRGKRVPLNRDCYKVEPSYELIEAFGNLCAYSLSLNTENKVINVEMDKEAKLIFSKLENRCDVEINSSEADIKHQLWNRVSLKSMKLASLVAIGINPINPVIDAKSANWAINLITNDVSNFIRRFDAGEVGENNDEYTQLEKVMDSCKKFVMSPFSQVEKYASGLSQLHSERIIPYSYIQRNVAGLSTFRKDRIGARSALKRAIDTLIERGDIAEVSRKVLSDKYHTTSRSFMISNPRAFGL